MSVAARLLASEGDKPVVSTAAVVEFATASGSPLAAGSVVKATAPVDRLGCGPMDRLGCSPSAVPRAY